MPNLWSQHVGHTEAHWFYTGGCGLCEELHKNFSRTLVCHGDLDGLASAAAYLREQSERYCDFTPTRLVVTQPFFLDKIEVKGKVVVLDIAVNNRDVEMTRQFAAAHKVVAWWDHHGGGDPLVEILGERAHVGDAPSCVALMATGGIDVPEEMLAVANAADCPTDFPQTELSVLLNRALKVALVEQNEGGVKNRMEQVQQAIILYLFNHADPLNLGGIASRYEALEAATKMAADGLTIVAQCGDLVIAGTTLHDGALVDKTALFMRGYKQAGVVCLRYHAQDGREVTTIATADKGLNLVGGSALYPARLFVSPSLRVTGKISANRCSKP